MTTLREALRHADKLDRLEFDEPHGCAAELRRLHAEVEATRADAERYRWLRDQTTDDGIAIVMKNKHIDDSISYPDNINGYIDAARSKA
jgi:hypothetical protein